MREDPHAGFCESRGVRLPPATHLMYGGPAVTAFRHLAAAVTQGGGELRYHGDFDWPGVAIAGSVMRRHGARPWRMSAADYNRRGAG